MDRLHISELELWTHLGVPDEERAKEQRVLVSVWMEIDSSKAGKSDDIEDSIDYQKVADRMRELAKVERKTIEKFGNDIADAILKEFKPKEVTVNVRKFAIPGSESVSLTLTRP